MDQKNAATPRSIGTAITKFRDNLLLLVISAGLALGLAVALVVYVLWSSHAVPPESQQTFTVAALALCPSYILTIFVGSASNTPLEKGLLLTSLVSANAFLYAGVAAFVYFLAKVFFRPRRPTGQRSG